MDPIRNEYLGKKQLEDKIINSILLAKRANAPQMATPFRNLTEIQALMVKAKELGDLKREEENQKTSLGDRIQ